jgi:uncharacterized membrane protein
MPNFKLILQILLFVAMLTAGNILWKYGIVNIGGVFVNGKTFFNSIKYLLVSPYIWLGTLFYIIGTLYWFTLLSRHNLSHIYPMVSIGYVLAALAGVLLFKETIPLTGWIGMGIIFVGFIVLSIR